MIQWVISSVHPAHRKGSWECCIKEEILLGCTWWNVEYYLPWKKVVAFNWCSNLYDAYLEFTQNDEFDSDSDTFILFYNYNFTAVVHFPVLSLCHMANQREWNIEILFLWCIKIKISAPVADSKNEGIMMYTVQK